MRRSIRFRWRGKRARRSSRKSRMNRRRRTRRRRRGGGGGGRGGEVCEQFGGSFDSHKFWESPDLK